MYKVDLIELYFLVQGGDELVLMIIGDMFW